MSPGEFRARLAFRIDDLSAEAVRALITQHVVRMHAHSPAQSVHALNIDGLRSPDITLFSGWRDAHLVCVGALKQLDEARAELKSMRVADDFLGRGYGRALLDHLVSEARARGVKTLWLETGTAPAFEPARRLYARAGFAPCPAFPPYIEDANSTFMMRVL
jgi:putative acetyltransferase